MCIRPFVPQHPHLLSSSESPATLFHSHAAPPAHTDYRSFAARFQKLFEIYFGGYTRNISNDFISSFKEHSGLCDEKDGTKGQK